MERVYLFKTLYAASEGHSAKYVYKIGHTKNSTSERTRGALTMTPNSVIEILSLECEKSIKVETLFQDIFKESRIKSYDISGNKSRKTEWFDLSKGEYNHLIKKFELLRDAFALDLIWIMQKNKTNINALPEKKTQKNKKTWIEVGIKNGDKFIFSKDSRIIVSVKNVEARIVSYMGKEYKLSPLVKKILNTKVEKQGTLFFLYKGIQLAKLLGTYHGR